MYKIPANRPGSLVLRGFVVENNSLSVVVQGGKLAVQGCTKVAACRNALVEKGLGALLGIGAAETALDNLSSSDQQYVFAVAMNGGQADLVEKLTPEQRAAYDYIVEQDKKGTYSLLPAQQSSTDKPSSGPNVAKDLTDAEKAEAGGTGTGTPPPPENDPKNSEEKKVDKLNQKQESSVRKIDNLIKNSLKDHDITGSLKDMDGNPIPKPDSPGQNWNHMKEMQDDPIHVM
ncbi:polymorphic toxin type 28 domain-containing protein [Buttiauxella ferragutiae]|uniref:polymorphic toxin type 28 domain-containing protein n=1 Tax=Buttiauxella ferragutiae TaxID=82989 RepID=UPI001F539B6A|nr:polymorphic toxin type 28 domain-containing protein [Buttiauxella ferragutiae]UNK63084.1 polymorphic toxin type 28 domain-containing protein [Buttiauxella ferragutiae]